MIKVLIADDHAVVRKGLRKVIEEEPDMSVVGEASDGEQALQQLHREDWDVLVLDIAMPRCDGLEVLLEAQRSKPQHPVLILSVYPEDQFGRRVLQAGAAGYMSKAEAISALVPAIRKVLQGGKYVNSTLAEHFAYQLDDTVSKPLHDTLTNREYHILRMLGTGQRPSEMARELSLSVKTISTYRARVMMKMGFKSNAEMMRYVIEHHLT